jgi:hypothetical protein
MSTDSDERTTVDLYVSAGDTAVWNRQENVIARLERAEREGDVDHFSVQVWARKVSVSGPMSASKFHRAAVRSVEEFESWADAVDADVELPCERESVDCEFTGDEYHLMRPPTVCAAVYRGGRLAGVYPCRVDGDPRTVEDLLDAIEASDPTIALPAEGTKREVESVD